MLAPIAVVLFPLAIVKYPIAVELFPLAVVPFPIAEEFMPELVVCACLFAHLYQMILKLMLKAN